MVLHIPYTICRSGTYYYNRHVPKHAVEAYGAFIRQALSKCPEEAEAYVKRLGNVLEGSWSNTTSIQPVDIPTILFSFKPRSFKLSEIATDFDGLTAHCLRHTFRDRLRAVECPMDLIDQIGGWKSVSSIGNNYGLGYRMEPIKIILGDIKVDYFSTARQLPLTLS